MSAESSRRLTALMQEKEVTVKALADYVGVSTVAVRKWLTKGDVPRGDRLIKLCEMLGVTPAYLVFGDDSARPQTVRADDGSIAVPYLDVEASCGGGLTAPDHLSLRRFVRLDPRVLADAKLNVHAGSLNLITAVGDSMEPTIKSGDAVIVDVSQSEVNRDGLYAVAFNRNLFIKRVQCLPTGYRMLSDNPRYAPIEIESFDSVRVVGRCFIGLQITIFY